MAWIGVFGISAFTVLFVTLAVTFGDPIPEAEASEPFIGEIRYFGFNFAPRGWALCQGQLLPIAQNTALFSLYGTTYGGDGLTTFGLPDDRGRVLIGMGQGPGLSNYSIGMKGGAEKTTLTIAQMPLHSHSADSLVLQGTPVVGNSAELTGNALALSFARSYSTTAPTAAMHADSIDGNIGNTGGNQSHDIRQPYLTVNCSIALTGIFPSRN